MIRAIRSTSPNHGYPTVDPLKEQPFHQRRNARQPNHGYPTVDPLKVGGSQEYASAPPAQPRLSNRGPIEGDLPALRTVHALDAQPRLSNRGPIEGYRDPIAMAEWLCPTTVIQPWTH